MNRPAEVPEWATSELMYGGGTDWSWTDGDGWRHIVCVDNTGSVHRRYEAAGSSGSPNYPTPPMVSGKPPTDHTVVLVGVDRGVPRWELECNHDDDFDAKFDLHSWWSEDGITLVDIPSLDVQPRFPVRTVWLRPGEPILVARKDTGDE